MIDYEQAVKDFHIKFGGKVNEPFTLAELVFRSKLIEEELEEVVNELDIDVTTINPANLTKEIADTIYVLIGMCVTFGLPINEVFKRVHESNMTKTQEDKRDDGKIRKGEGYVPPVLHDLFDGWEYNG